MANKKVPLCQILIPAPWQQKEEMGRESSGWEREEHRTDEMSTEELTALIWSIDETRTPLDESSVELAEEMSEAENDE